MNEQRCCENTTCKHALCYPKCEHYNPKMTFFEAWEKADYAVTNGIVKIIKDNPSRVMVTVGALFKKEWKIIPKKKTVTIDIPKDATKLKVSYVYGRKDNKIEYTQKP